MTLGKLAWPYPVERCSSADCQREFQEGVGAFLFRDLDSDKLCVFCEDCSAYVELSHRDRFLLVAL